MLRGGESAGRDRGKHLQPGARKPGFQAVCRSRCVETRFPHRCCAVRNRPGRGKGSARGRVSGNLVSRRCAAAGAWKPGFHAGAARCGIGRAGAKEAPAAGCLETWFPGGVPQPVRGNQVSTQVLRGAESAGRGQRKCPRPGVWKPGLQTVCRSRYVETRFPRRCCTVRNRSGEGKGSTRSQMSGNQVSRQRAPSRRVETWFPRGSRGARSAGRGRGKRPQSHLWKPGFQTADPEPVCGNLVSTHPSLPTVDGRHNARHRGVRLRTA
ncbi:hypothetical protein SAMN05518854_11571 [Variovorax sp. YR266]|nr:hypothetical protein SAMN05518854_11571 [Variovorax sp. YR266]